ncbi:uncharacterized protein K489DRAFT_366325 [Dissoconium aciculare CBS 342.82]|uniref:Secreted protein n=1 Tax=Dissoconium aciculare CBS 342.82 TaxID=1314786 RepID=A0A6J3MGQ9_9PEZI|nr:uncharacterized protein K489DRAFT_366325 [Dissoconium aciculare CBS 342.82]KAF1827135.1 hypothetical protein K489DRAFT_366325 [Dissoconium aciculare CBS 342.82]
MFGAPLACASLLAATLGSVVPCPGRTSPLARGCLGRPLFGKRSLADAARQCVHHRAEARKPAQIKCDDDCSAVGNIITKETQWRVVSIEYRFSRPDAITAAPASTLQCANVSVCKRRCGRVDHWRCAGGQQTTFKERIVTVGSRNAVRLSSESRAHRGITESFPLAPCRVQPIGGGNASRPQHSSVNNREGNPRAKIAPEVAAPSPNLNHRRSNVRSQIRIVHTSRSLSTSFAPPVLHTPSGFQMTRVLAQTHRVVWAHEGDWG